MLAWFDRYITRGLIKQVVNMSVQFIAVQHYCMDGVFSSPFFWVPPWAANVV